MRNTNLKKAVSYQLLAISLIIVLSPMLVSAQSFNPPEGGPIPELSTASQVILRVIEILLAIAGLVAVIFLIVGGFRYITAGGNEETAEGAKKTLVNAIIGVVIVILAFVIVRVISNALINQAV